MSLSAFLLAALLFVQEAGRQVDQWIRDLGADSYEAREKAEVQLRRIGQPALPALKKAVVDDDVERAQRARRLLSDLENSDKPSGRTEVRTATPELMREISFVSYRDGRVELTIREENKRTGKKDYRTYTAASVDEFKSKYPQIAQEHDFDRWIPRPASAAAENNKADESWDEWKRRFDRDWFWDQGVGKFLKPWMPLPPAPFGRWLEHRLSDVEELRQRGHTSAPLGIVTVPVNEALASQLGLDPGKGILVEKVLPESRAEQAGLQKHDILMKVNGEQITSPDQLRKTLRALKDKGFELAIVRKGKADTIEVEPAGRE
jgi:hypothetical protein